MLKCHMQYAMHEIKKLLEDMSASINEILAIVKW
jgi:hypothetical protein